VRGKVFRQKIASIGSLILVLALSACGRTTETISSDSAPSTIFYLVQDGAGASLSGVPIGHLMSVTIEGEQEKEIATLGAVNRTFSVDPEHDRVALATDYTDSPELLLVDVESGSVETVSSSQGGDHSVALGPDGRIAYCDYMGVFRVGFVSGIAESAPVERHRPGQGCPDAGWRRDGTLAFVAQVPLDNPDLARPQALYLRAGDGSLNHIELPGIVGYSQASWSSDGSRVTFSAHDRIIIVEVASGRVQDVGPGTDPLFAPDDPDRFVARRFEETGRFVDVWQGGKLAASLQTLDEIGGLALCPRRNEVVFTTPVAVQTWNWRTGERGIVARGDVQDYKLIEPSVACF
jgi:hypothetical protein